VTKTVSVLRWDGQAPTIDGRLDERGWRLGSVLDDFVQKEPVEGAAPTLRTVIRVAIDAEALYIGAEMETAPGELRAPVGRRDDDGQADYVLVSLDTYADGRTAYSFGVTAGGTRLDRYHATDNEFDYDEGFDPVWTARTTRDGNRWTAEMRIPLSQLRFNQSGDQRWGLNVVRSMPAREELVFWVPVGRNETGWASRFGVIEDLGRIQAARGVELLPYIATGASFFPDPDPADPFAVPSESTVRAGADIKVGLGSNLTLDATFNPDFGQVEADPAEVNLSQFETFFPERRPFFTEGSNLTNRSGLFYSRRIGGLPPVPIDAAYADAPKEATILGATKLTGRLVSGTSLGLLGAVTDRESAQVWSERGGLGTQALAPRTYTGVATVVQEFGAEASTVGLQVAGLRRAMGDADPLAEYLHRSAVGARLDWNLRFRDGTYEAFGAVGVSHVRGDSTALLRTQRSSVHYFQRPDQDHVSVDSTRTSLSGGNAFVGVNKNAGTHWLWDLFLAMETPGLELNDAGRLGDAGEYGAFATLTYRETVPGSWYRRYRWSVSQENLWTFGRDRQFGALRTDAQIVLPNFWTVDVTAWRDFAAVSKSLSRGGPLVGTPPAWVVIARLGNSSAANTRWNARIYHGESQVGERTQRLSGGVSIRPGPRLQLSVDPNYLRVTEPRQYGGTRSGGPAETFGNRYIFSFIERSTLLARIRASYALRPDLTLELYAEPFVASGRFHRYGELTEPRSRGLRAYGTDGSNIEEQPDGSLAISDGEDAFTIPYRDFHVRSFRSNAVLRWEWRPGSTVFLVWQQDRFSDLRTGELVRVGDLWDTLVAPGENRFIIKASYWLPVG